MVRYCYNNEKKYVICSRISKKKFRQIIRLFSENLSATQTFHLTELSRQSIHKYLETFA